MRTQRRLLIKSAAVGTLAFAVGGVDLFLTSREARAKGVPLSLLKEVEARSLEAVGEAMVPGAREEGIAHFIDQQCSIAPHEALLSLRIANGRPPFINFYRSALVEIERQCGAKHGKAFGDLTASDQHAFIDLVRQSKVADWGGPPQRQVYGVFRDDAVDVVYGTVSGFERLGVPYMPHIPPTERW